MPDKVQGDCRYQLGFLLIDVGQRARLLGLLVPVVPEKDIVRQACRGANAIKLPDIHPALLLSNACRKHAH